MPTKKLFLATDGSPNAEAGLQLLLSGPWPPGIIFGVVTVADKLISIGHLSDVEAGMLANRVGTLVKDRYGLGEVQIWTLSGAAADSILELIQDQRPDWMVIGAHGQHDLITELLGGNVVDRLIRQSITSLFVVRAKQKARLQRVLLCLGSADTATEILMEVLNFHWKAEVEFMLVHVFQPPLGEYSPSPKRDVQLFQHAEKVARADASAFVNQGIDALQKSLPENVIHGSVLEDFFPAQRIVDLCTEWNADLVVLGPREHFGISELVMGSVSKEVLRWAPCSVHLVVPQL